jgi:hypothetical protein
MLKLLAIFGFICSGALADDAGQPKNKACSSMMHKACRSATSFHGCHTCAKKKHHQINFKLELMGEKCTKSDVHAYCRFAFGKHSKLVKHHSTHNKFKSCQDEIAHLTCKPHSASALGCVKCVKKHADKMNSGGIKNSMCTMAKLDSFCGFAVYKVTGDQAADDCRWEIKESTCEIDKTNGLQCAQCVKKHRAKINADLIKKTKCTDAIFNKFCGFKKEKVTAYVGATASNDCRWEIKESTCDIDTKGSLGCLKCVQDHKKKINAGLMKGSKCTDKALQGFCGYKEVDVLGDKATDDCRWEIKHSSCNIDSFKHDGAGCQSCLDKHKAKINKGLIPNAKCTLREFGKFCGFSGKATPGSRQSNTCRAEVKKYSCDIENTKGMACSQCVEDHRKKMLSDLGSNSQCTDAHLQSFCGFTEFKVSGSKLSDDCKWEVQQSTCNLKDNGSGGVDCVKCVERHKKAMNKKLVSNSKCTDAILDGFCGVKDVAVDKGRSASNDCRWEIMHSTCKVDQMQGQACNECIAKHKDKIDQGLIKNSRCTDGDFDSFCGFRGSMVRGSKASNDCRWELKEKTCEIDTTNSFTCLQCIANHKLNRAVDSKCKDAQLDSFCGFKTKSAAAKHVVDSCADEIRWNTCGIDKAGKSCLKCVDDHKKKVKLGVIPASKCTSKDLMGYCGYREFDVSGAKASDDCRWEAQKTCDLKSTRNNGAGCVKCVEKHKHAIAQGLIQNSKCTSSVLDSFCGYKTVAIAGDTASDDCAWELKTNSGGCKLDENGAQCTACVNRHWKNVQAGLVPASKCTRAKLDSFCGFREVVVKGTKAADDCRWEIKKTSCDIDTTRNNGAACQACVAKHLGAIDKGLVPGSKCSKTQMMGFCGFSQYIMKGNSLSDDCKYEMKSSTCDVDAIHGDHAACMSCVKRHSQKIDNHLVANTKCTKTQMHAFCKYGQNAKKSRPDLKTCIGVLKDVCIKNQNDFDSCMGCVKGNIGLIDAGRSTLCSTEVLHSGCAKYGAAGDRVKFQKESKGCETELKAICGANVLKGPKCMSCIKNHVQRIDDGLAGSATMCSKYQFDHFCFFYGTGAEDASTAGIEKLKAKTPTCQGEVKQYCGSSLLGAGRDCVACVKNHVAAIDAGMSSMCKTSQLENICGAQTYKPKQETRSCEQAIKNQCPGMALKGPHCAACVKNNIGYVDGSLAGSTKLCSDYQIEHFCFFYGGGGEDASTAGIEKLSAKVQQDRRATKFQTHSCKSQLNAVVSQDKDACADGGSLASGDKQPQECEKLDVDLFCMQNQGIGGDGDGSGDGDGAKSGDGDGAGDGAAGGDGDGSAKTTGGDGGDGSSGSSDGDGDGDGNHDDDPKNKDW